MGLPTFNCSIFSLPPLFSLSINIVNDKMPRMKQLIFIFLHKFGRCCEFYPRLSQKTELTDDAVYLHHQRFSLEFSKCRAWPRTPRGTGCASYWSNPRRDCIPGNESRAQRMRYPPLYEPQYSLQSTDKTRRSFRLSRRFISLMIGSDSPAKNTISTRKKHVKKQSKSASMASIVYTASILIKVAKRRITYYIARSYRRTKLQNWNEINFLNVKRSLARLSLRHF